MGMSRSQNMALIKGRDTGPEMVLRRALWARGLRYRIHASTPCGKPDLVFPGPKVAVYVDGCQWHGCPEHYVRPRTRTDFWSAKLAGTLARDRRQTLRLEAEGWQVLRFWEHEVVEELEAVATQVEAAVRTASWDPGPSLRVASVEPLTLDGNVERRHLEALRDPAVKAEVVQERSTRKWSRR